MSFVKAQREPGGRAFIPCFDRRPVCIRHRERWGYSGKPEDVTSIAVWLLSPILHTGKLSLSVTWHFNVFYASRQALTKVSSWLPTGPLVLSSWGLSLLIWMMVRWASPHLCSHTEPW